MRKKIITFLLFFQSYFCYAQFEEEIAELQKGGGHFLGYFHADTLSHLGIKDTLDVSIDLAQVNHFYLTLEVNDTTFNAFVSYGGQNNFLWTDRVLKQKHVGGKSCFLVKIFWHYDKKRFEYCECKEVCRLGVAHMGIGQKGDYYSKRKGLSISFVLFKRNKQ